ncbi:site-2 protease family protein [Marinobacterium jannaschii]|uniref:site-2 protease family protein n=1 Tax=Marinobacterium jannaschii TaxID=64970 RepID=UPI00048824A2|nr:site-2 protease family protein [Marinobacterium jannaschii]
MELLNTEFLGRPLRLEGNMAGWQQLYWDNQLVSERVASADDGEPIEHHFELQHQHDESSVRCSIILDLEWQPFSISYRALVNDQAVAEGARDGNDLGSSTPSVVTPERPQLNMMGLASLGFKLFKSAKVIKVLLAGLSVAAYAWLFSLQFALALIACLVVHEYGHVRAMKHFGMKTKGIYLIPFLGGLALSENKVNTRWQDVVIAIMGPTFGLGMSVLLLLAYWMTGEMIFAGLSAFNALLNLFNLLPVLPLDGGHILKSISFSMNSIVGLVVCILAAVAGVYVSYTFGLALLGFLLLIGSVEILLEWRYRQYSRLLPLDRYGQIFSFVWYLLTVAGLVGIIIYFAGSGDAVLGLPLKVLQS